MVFSSALFLVFFLPLFLLVYFITPRKWKNHVALTGSVVFYTWGAPVFSLLLLLSGALDYLISGSIVNGSSQARRWLALGVGYNVLTLFIFKYFNFFTENAAAVAKALGLGFPHYMEVALPIGISFFTFQKISYLVDVYRGDTPPAKKLIDYWLFVFLFPQLIAGPIVRYKDIASQITGRFESGRWAERLSGVFRFVLGLSKKVLVADALAPFVDQAFVAENLSSPTAWLALLAYAMQIYFDFSGYSDMAIGLGKMMDFHFPENFNWPYISRGFMEFWRRWHITLGSWMRDYLYIPLGGNRGPVIRTLFNLWLVFLLSGLWHGASWNFVTWGAWHGLFISLDRFTALFRRLPSMVSMLLTFGLVTLGWVWFRADTLAGALRYWDMLFAFETGTTLLPTARQGTVLVIALLFSLVPVSFHPRFMYLVEAGGGYSNLIRTGVCILLFILCLGQLALTGGQPFIYFRF